jgi:hypothetical protein
MRGVAVMPSWRPAVAPPESTADRAEVLDPAIFRAIEIVYLRHGGILCVDQVASLMRAGEAQPVSRLARWIVEGSVVHFEWHSRVFLPMFQFEVPGLSLRPEAVAVMAELKDVFDDLGLALWFARSNSLLDGDAPIDRMADDAAAVVQAARADRFAFLG